MVKLRNTGDKVSLYAPEGDPNGMILDSGEVLDVPGEVAKPPTEKELDEGAEPLPADAIIVILPDGDRRAFATSRWELVPEKTAKKSADN